jgi:2-oxoglutarate ferredoxin oxidoreductase subunit beta
MPRAFGEGGLNFPVLFLEHEDGIPVPPSLLKRGRAQPHNHRDINEAQRIAVAADPAPMGLIYENPEVPVYEEIRRQRQDRPDRATFLRRLDTALDRYTVT